MISAIFHTFRRHDMRYYGRHNEQKQDELLDLDDNASRGMSRGHYSICKASCESKYTHSTTTTTTTTTFAQNPELHRLCRPECTCRSKLAPPESCAIYESLVKNAENCGTNLTHLDVVYIELHISFQVTLGRLP